MSRVLHQAIVKIDFLIEMVRDVSADLDCTNSKDKFVQQLIDIMRFCKKDLREVLKQAQRERKDRLRRTKLLQKFKTL